MKRRRLVITLSVVALCACALLAYLLVSGRDPVYKGKALKAWLSGYDSSGASPNAGLTATPFGMVGDSSADWKAADEALVHFGSNAVPTVDRLLGARDSALKLKLVALVKKQSIIKIDPPPATHWNHVAITALQRLGSDALGALPAMTNVYVRNLAYQSRARSNDYPAEYLVLSIPPILGGLGPVASNAIPALLQGAAASNANVRWIALAALGNIHADPATVVPILTRALADRDEYTRMEALRALVKFGTGANPAVPAMLPLLRDPQPSVRYVALQAFRTGRYRPEVVVPELAKSLNDTNNHFEAVLTLQAYGDAALPAVPQLIEYIHRETNINLRATAALIVTQIDPEAAAKAGVK